MRAVLAARFPDHAILGEEGGEERPGARWRWVLDPIDGTRAFITGRPIWGTLIALLDGDTPVLGLLDQPITGERWVGAAGQPTRFTGAHGHAGTRRRPSLAEAEMAATSPAIFPPAERQRWDRLAGCVRRVSWGGDCYLYGLLALGQIDVVAEATLKIWDWAALVPIVTGAGGSITDWSGRPPRADGDGSILALGDPSLLPAATAALEDPACD
jgi:myo-inositol-1(or 4)-monophosphatase